MCMTDFLYELFPFAIILEVKLVNFQILNMKRLKWLKNEENLGMLLKMCSQHFLLSTFFTGDKYIDRDMDCPI